MTLLDLKLKYKAETGNKWERYASTTDLENVDQVRWLIEKYFELNEKYNDTLCKKTKKYFKKTSTTANHTPPKVKIITTSENTPKKIIIDSDLLPKWVNWVAKDENEKWFCYDKKPELTLNQWFWRSGQFSDILSGFIPKFDGDWKDSLFRVVRKKTFDKTSEIFKS